MRTKYRMVTDGEWWKVETEMKPGFWMPITSEYRSEKACRTTLILYRENEARLEAKRLRHWKVVDGPED